MGGWAGAPASGPSVALDACFAGCNRVVNALDWSGEGLIAFAAHNNVVLYDPAVRCAGGLAESGVRR